MKRKHPEDDLAIAVASFLRVAAPDLLWWHTPNGGNRGLNEAKRFKAMGVLPGVFDLCFILPGPEPLFIELKSGKGQLSPAQEDFKDECIFLNVAQYIARSVEDVATILKIHGVPLRAHLSKELVK